MENRFERYRKGTIAVDLGDGGTPLELKVTVADKGEILSLQKEKDAKLSFDKSSEILRRIIKASYPGTDESVIDSLIVEKGDTIWMNLAIAFGWLTKEMIEKRFEKKLESQ